MNILNKIFGTHSEREIKRIMPLVTAVEAKEDEYRQLSDHELRGRTEWLRDRLKAGETLDDILPDAFATIREAAWRVLGMRHYRVQIIGGIVLHQGRIAEMKTGEGKTLVATLPVYLNALTGQGVHVVTVNDYLATRDSEWMGKVYTYLGLTVGLIVHGLDNDARRQAYASDIVYGTNNEFGFDYLRDNMVTHKSEMVQRELQFAIVDEVDSILIDEARTPLIISGQGEASTDMYKKVNSFVTTLKPFVVAETDSKEDQDELAGDADYIVDEKAKTAVMTRNGVSKAEQYFQVNNLADEENYDLQHYINNALKAHGTMHRDDQYVVQDGEVIIVDDFTGRLMYGRRYSDGLHQAIEAKEGVKVENESKTLATITFQNYFRMYAKLSGMTGTALTEEDEFRSIYSLDVICIPTNRPIARLDEHDSIYKTERGKYKAIIEEVKKVHAQGQPVLIGTVSVEKSELLSDLFTRVGIKHNVLNAKQHQREAEIVAQAGRYGAVTISTNMAGRGTDILLGGNPEYMAKAELRKQGFEPELVEQSTTHNETDDPLILDIRQRYQELEKNFSDSIKDEKDKVIKAGGLYILGTERHESRRIDNQLRGRAGRQGDPGKSKFYLSLEDDLLRLFGGDRMTKLFNSLGVDEDMELQNRMLSKQIENAQKKVEGRNFGIRKHVLEYDDVMNKQREVIYAQRRRVLEGEDLQDTYRNMIESTLKRVFAKYCNPDEPAEEWEISGLTANLLDITGPIDPVLKLKELIAQNNTLDEIIDITVQAALDRYASREDELGSPELMREIERVILLRSVDQKWMDHIDLMDDLRDSIGMRSYAQHDPVMEYKMEGFQMFEEMNNSIQEAAVRMILRANFRPEEPIRRENSLRRIEEHKAAESSFAEAKAAAGQSERQGEVNKDANHKPLIRDKNKVGRNDPCPCGSGKKYKNCCGRG